MIIHLMNKYTKGLRMDPKDRKAAIAAYKDTKTVAGVFVVRCSNGKVWVLESRHIDTHKTGLWFSLRMGSYPDREMQKAWNDNGAESFSFEVLEKLPSDTSPTMMKSELKILARQWRERLS